MRLTERKVCYPRCDNKGNLDKVEYIAIKDKKLAEEKLCQLEDIEDKLGIDLVTLFKALKDGIYVKFDNGDIDFVCGGRIGIIKHYGRYYLTINELLGRYKLLINSKNKIWALTKEELL